MKSINIASIVAVPMFLLMVQGTELPARGEICEASIQELKDLIESKGGLVSGINMMTSAVDLRSRTHPRYFMSDWSISLGSGWEEAPHPNKIV